MIRTADACWEGLRDGRKVWIDDERVADVTTHPAFKPIIDLKARMYEMASESGGSLGRPQADDRPPVGQMRGFGSRLGA
jgi:aromatic ring hydroxylase